MLGANVVLRFNQFTRRMFTGESGGGGGEDMGPITLHLGFGNQRKRGTSQKRCIRVPIMLSKKKRNILQGGLDFVVQVHSAIAVIFLRQSVALISICLSCPRL